MNNTQSQCVREMKPRRAILKRDAHPEYYMGTSPSGELQWTAFPPHALPLSEEEYAEVVRRIGTVHRVSVLVFPVEDVQLPAWRKKNNGAVELSETEWQLVCTAVRRYHSQLEEERERPAELPFRRDLDQLVAIVADLERKIRYMSERTSLVGKRVDCLMLNGALAFTATCTAETDTTVELDREFTGSNLWSKAHCRLHLEASEEVQ